MLRHLILLAAALVIAITVYPLLAEPTGHVPSSGVIVEIILVVRAVCYTAIGSRSTGSSCSVP